MITYINICMTTNIRISKTNLKKLQTIKEDEHYSSLDAVITELLLKYELYNKSEIVRLIKDE